MNSLSISTSNFEPNTKLTKQQLSDLEDTLDEEGIDREIILDVAQQIHDNTLSPLTENELERMIYMLKEKKGNLREIKSILLRALMMAVPALNGGKKKSIRSTRRKTRRNIQRKKSIRRK